MHARPALPRQPAAPIPTSGNFTVRDDFDGPELARYWNFIRTPREKWYDLASPRGWLTLRARPVDIGGRGQPSFVGRRQQHTHAVVSTAIRYVPTKTGDKAGLIAFHNEAHYYFLAVSLTDAGPVVQLERRDGATGSGPTIIASAPLELSRASPLYLKIETRGGRYDFSYGYRPNEWRLIKGDADGTILSTKVAGGFVGTLFGMYAYAALR
jgi:alpha-N-arabinofuranosidase